MLGEGGTREKERKQKHRLITLWRTPLRHKSIEKLVYCSLNNVAEPPATKQLKFDGTGAFWKHFFEAPTRSAFLLIQLQPHGLTESTLAQQQRARERAENLMLHSRTSPKWSYSVSVSLTS